MRLNIGRKGTFFPAIVALVLALSLLGFFTRDGGKLVRLDFDKENELRQNWNNYMVYIRDQGINTYAVLYRIKGKKQIILPDDWKEEGLSLNLKQRNPF
jgi:hypothetical protein